MSDQIPDYSLDSVPAERGVEKPELFLVKHFQTKEADYMKPPLAEQLLEPDGKPAGTASGPGGHLGLHVQHRLRLCSRVDLRLQHRLHLQYGQFDPRRDEFQ